MNALSRRVRDDLDELNRRAHAALGSAGIPPSGTWTRCWDKRLEEPVGMWHRISTTDGTRKVAYCCTQVGIVTIIAAIRMPARFAIQRCDGVPSEACPRCLR